MTDELILYASDTGQTRLNLRVEAHTVWLPQPEIAEMFQSSKQNVSLRAKNRFEDNELCEDSVVKESLTTQIEDLWQVERLQQSLKNRDKGEE